MHLAQAARQIFPRALPTPRVLTRLNHGTASRAFHALTVTRQATEVDPSAGAAEGLEETTKEPLTADGKLSPALYAFNARLGFKFSDPKILVQALTHPSHKYGKTDNNSRYAWLGQKIVGLYASEFFYTKYPNLVPSTLQNLLDIHFSTYALGAIGKELGVGFVFRWRPPHGRESTGGLTWSLGTVMEALIGALYEDQGPAAAKRFIHAFLLSRSFELEAAMELEQPKMRLIALTRKKNMEYPVARLLKETGRLTHSPVYIVGMFSGSRKIGEGFGSSLQMAEVRACKDALIRYYMNERKDFKIPSDLEQLNEDDVSFFRTEVEEVSPTTA
ncbi:54S ribosomal protein L3 mitochondrial [Dimargaris xerosporica]|nr:54S ribosomal protein L3 mitochondrial [Dimargaris xerosporica]